MSDLKLNHITHVSDRLIWERTVRLINNGTLGAISGLEELHRQLRSEKFTGSVVLHYGQGSIRNINFSSVKKESESDYKSDSDKS